MGKKLIFLILTTFGFGSPLFVVAQTEVFNVFTPNNTRVTDTYVLPELSGPQIAALNNMYETNYPLATKIADASNTYNCHGYAWHMTEGGSAVWIGYHGPTAEYEYWNDDSYIEICNPIFPAKVSYGPYQDHSAITTGTPGVFLSKWADGPVMEHAFNYSPYGSSDLRYYVRATSIIPIAITGTATIADSATYSVSTTRRSSYKLECNGIV